MNFNNKKPAVCALVVREDGLILGVSRKNDSTAWGLPGGQVENGETDEEAIKREVREETGLEFFDLNEVYYVRSDDQYWCRCFMGVVKGEIHTEEAGKVAWVEPLLLTNGPFGKYNKQLFESLFRNDLSYEF